MIKVCYFEVPDAESGDRLTDFLSKKAGLSFLARTIPALTMEQYKLVIAENRDLFHIEDFTN